MRKDKNTDLPELQRRIALYEDESAYKEIFFRFFNPLKKFASDLLKSKELAEETVSDIFVEIWSARKRLEEISDLRMYLYVSVRNAAVRKLRKVHQRSMISLETVSVELASNYASPEEAILTSELSQKIERAINELPPRCKLVYKLAKENKLKYKEISQLLDINIKTIDNHLAMALKKIAASVNIQLKKKLHT
jgi:RNA polymerase sigma-70 factor (ECF subfamily)